MFPDIENFVDTRFRQAGSLSDGFQALTFRSEFENFLVAVGFCFPLSFGLDFLGRETCPLPMRDVQKALKAFSG